MSTPNPDERALADGRHDRLGELSPPERDFLARRMPVEPVNCAPLDALRVDLGAPLTLIDRKRLDDELGNLHSFAWALRRGRIGPGHADELYSIAARIREALK